MEKEKSNGKSIILFIILLVVLLLVVFIIYNMTTKQKDTQNIIDSTEKNITNDIEAKNIEVSAKYTEDDVLDKLLINNNNVLNSMTEKTIYKELKLKNKLVSDNLAFVNVYDYGTQFDENHLFIYDGDGKIVDYFHLLVDNDNDNNKYKYCGDFEYNTNTKTLTFTTELWLGEAEESAGAAFGDKSISELSKSELEKFKNYAYEVKYEYKLENGKFEFVKKDVLSKVMNVEYWKEYFN